MTDTTAMPSGSPLDGFALAQPIRRRARSAWAR
jgi:hypothetical protein